MKIVLKSILALSVVMSAVTSLSAGAVEAKQLCMTEFPTTSMMVVPSENENLNVKIFHHNGVDYLPLHMGIITPNDLAIMAKRADILKSLGEDLDLFMSAKNCQFVDYLNFSCFGYTNETTPKVNGKTVKLWSLYSYRQTDVSFAGTFDYVVMSANFDVDGESLSIGMKYQLNECTDQFNASRLNKFFK